MTDRNYLKFCLDLIAEKANNGPVSKWTDGDYIELSDAIESETRVLISRNTLKRLYSKMKTSEEYKPQKETKNALACYAGYQNWVKLKEMVALPAEFEQAGMPPSVVSGFGNEIAENLRLKVSLIQSNLKKWSLWFGGSGLVLFVALLFWFLKNQRKEVYVIENQVAFQILNPLDTVPYSLKLRYRLPKLADDSFAIKNFHLSIQDSVYNQPEILPGYDWLVLSHKGQAITSRAFHSISRKWMAFYQEKGKGTLKNIPDEYFQNGGLATPNSKFFINQNLDSNKFLFHLRHAKNFKLDADNMVFETRIYPNVGELDCKGLTTKLIGSAAQIEGAFFRKFCENHDFIFLPDHYYFGNRNDLSRIDLVAEQWNTLRIEVKNKTAFFFVNSTLVFKGHYSRPAGELKAIHLTFQGFCKFDYIRCWNKNGKLIENEEF